jgi:hypothetical protein
VRIGLITTLGIAPTNNLGEQAIGFVVIDRHVRHGKRRATILRLAPGRRWCQRIWTLVATTRYDKSCYADGGAGRSGRSLPPAPSMAETQHSRVVFRLLFDAVEAHRCGTPRPSLLPCGP